MKTIRMTKAEAVTEFQVDHLPRVRSLFERNGRADYAARREEWGVYTDALCKARMITVSQYERWGYPTCCLTPKTA